MLEFQFHSNESQQLIFPNDTKPLYNCTCTLVNHFYNDKNTGFSQITGKKTPAIQTVYFLARGSKFHVSLQPKLAVGFVSLKPPT